MACWRLRIYYRSFQILPWLMTSRYIYFFSSFAVSINYIQLWSVFKVYQWYLLVHFLLAIICFHVNKIAWLPFIILSVHLLFIWIYAGSYLLITGRLQQANWTVEGRDEWHNSWGWQHQKWYQCTCSKMHCYWSWWGMWGIDLPDIYLIKLHHRCSVFYLWLCTTTMLRSTCFAFNH